MVLLSAVDKGNRFSKKKIFFVVGTKTSFGKNVSKRYLRLIVLLW